MFKKIFALASVTTLMGVVSTVAAAGCSSTSTTEAATEDGGTSTEGGKDAGKTKTPVDAGGEEEPDAAPLPEEGTVGTLCQNDEACVKEGSKTDNICSKGMFGEKGGNDLFSEPVCIQPQCTQGSSDKVSDLLCDGNAGLCLLTEDPPSLEGICFPLCNFNSKEFTKPCNGDFNKCRLAYSATGPDGAVGIGYCGGACQVDTDCKTAGQKCQVETGSCVQAANLTTYVGKTVGASCEEKDPAECRCIALGGDEKDTQKKGYCTQSCVTGPSGDAACKAANAPATANWSCTARLRAPDFTAQLDGLVGQCALECAIDADCATLAGTVGVGANAIKCNPSGAKKWCQLTPPPKTP